MSLSTIIVEDEPLSMAFLQNLLAAYCPGVQVIATASTEAEAVAAITSLHPQLVLMDIELQQGNGFAVLQQSRHIDYHVIFTTALDYSGIRAIRFSGVNYLQKPIDIESLQAAINNLTNGENCCGKTALQHLLITLDNENQPKTLLLNTVNGYRYITLSEIIFISAKDGDCIFHTLKETVIAAGCNLRDYELMLNENSFFRVHTDYIIQLDKADFQLKSEPGTVTMINKAVIPVSPKKQAELGSLLFNPA